MGKINMMVVINVTNNLFNNLHIMGKYMINMCYGNERGKEGIISSY
jgi:hypothetical protein